MHARDSRKDVVHLRFRKLYLYGKTNGVYHSRSYGSGFRIEFRHLTNVPSFILNRIREKCGTHRNGKCLRINGKVSRYLNSSDLALDISADVLMIYIAKFYYENVREKRNGYIIEKFSENSILKSVECTS